MMKTMTVTLPALWASALVENEWSGLNFHAPDEAERVKTWLHNNPDLRVISCSDEQFVGQYEGITTECLEYTCEQVPSNQRRYPD